MVFGRVYFWFHIGFKICRVISSIDHGDTVPSAISYTASGTSPNYRQALMGKSAYFEELSSKPCLITERI